MCCGTKRKGKRKGCGHLTSLSAKSKKKIYSDVAAFGFCSVASTAPILIVCKRASLVAMNPISGVNVGGGYTGVGA